jgi:basic membrane protein A and related proteins
MRTSVVGSDTSRRLRSAGTLVCLGALLLSLVWTSSVSKAVRAAPPLGIGLVPTESGVDDMSFNWMAYQGLLRAETDFGVAGTVYTPSDPGDYAAQIQQCVDDGNVLCFTVGFAMGDATLAAALANPATHFAAVDLTWDSYPDNLRGTTFTIEQAGYLAGVLVAGMTQSGAVGGVGGLAVPAVVAFLDSYLLGAQCAKPGVDVLIDYTGTFADPDLGAQVAQQQMDQGADAIFGCGGLTGSGAILHATQNVAWGVGVDTDQWISLFESGAVQGSDKLLTSVMKRVDNVVYDTIADEVAGTFTPGTATYDLAAGGVGLAPYHETEASIPQAVKHAVEAARQGIINGTIDPWKPCTARSRPGSRQSGADGFGDPANAQVPSLEAFGDYLYAGTWNNDAEALGFEIWRTADGRAWEQVASELGDAAADLAVFGGYLYAGTRDGAVWRSPDGLAWAPVVTDGFGDPNNGIARFAVFDGMLYATTWSETGTEVWRTEDGEGWIPFGADGLGDPNNGAAISSAVYGSRLYLGTTNFSTGAQLWRTGGEGWEPLVIDGFGSAANSGVSSLAEFHGWLYAGLWNASGVEVWRWSEGWFWQRVVGPGGFGNPAANKANALEVLDGVLYLVVQNEETGLEVWRTADGTEWEQVGFGGFGDAHNWWSYWDNATTVFGGSLYVGTNNDSTGGEVWQMLWYRTYMPFVVRSY